jgi:hypothetical protein
MMMGQELLALTGSANTEHIAGSNMACQAVCRRVTHSLAAGPWSGSTGFVGSTGTGLWQHPRYEGALALCTHSTPQGTYGIQAPQEMTVAASKPSKSPQDSSQGCRPQDLRSCSQMCAHIQASISKA